MAEYKTYHFKITETKETFISVYAESLQKAVIRASVGPLADVLNKEGVEVLHRNTPTRSLDYIEITAERGELMRYDVWQAGIKPEDC